SNIVFNAGLYQKLPYDPLNDLVPVALEFNISYTLVGYKDLPYSTPKEVIAAAEANPAARTLANACTGTGQHILATSVVKPTAAKSWKSAIADRRRRFPICAPAASICSSIPRRRRSLTSSRARPRASPFCPRSGACKCPTCPP